MKVFLAVENNCAIRVLESLESLGVVLVNNPKDSDIAVFDSDAVATVMDALERVKNQCIFVIGYNGKMPSISWLSSSEYHWHDRFFLRPFLGRESVAEFLIQKLAEQ